MANWVRGFLKWWEKLPGWKAVPFIPVVMVLYVFAVIKNSITGDK
jgi:hypothetical protein